MPRWHGKCRSVISSSDTGPVVDVGFLVAVVVRVEVVLPQVVLGVDVVLVEVVAHVDLSENILQLGVVVEGDGREWVEVVGVNNLSLCHAIVLSLLGSFFLAGLIRLVSANIGSESNRVHQEVGAP